MAKNEKKQAPETNDGLTLIIGGLFVLFLVFATYSYFNKGSSKDDLVLDSGNESELSGAQNTDLSIGERIRELFNTRKGEISDDAVTDFEDDEDTATGTGGPIQMDYSVWVATDYKEGDIQGNTHVVQYGDTLWEIAEAAYGDGAMWTKILGANSSDIGFLPNGQQALIFAGQTLTIPR